jgi:hypothetical protein
LRAQVIAVYLLGTTLIGLAIGPAAVAALTDFHFHDDNALANRSPLSRVSPACCQRWSSRRALAHTVADRRSSMTTRSARARLAFAPGLVLLLGACAPKDEGLVQEVAAMRQELGALRQQAQRADDYIAIANLQAAYGYYADKALWDQAADLFAREERWSCPGAASSWA